MNGGHTMLLTVINVFYHLMEFCGSVYLRMKNYTFSHIMA